MSFPLWAIGHGRNVPNGLGFTAAHSYQYPNTWANECSLAGIESIGRQDDCSYYWLKEEPRSWRKEEWADFVKESQGRPVNQQRVVYAPNHYTEEWLDKYYKPNADHIIIGSYRLLAKYPIQFTRARSHGIMVCLTTAKSTLDDWRYDLYASLCGVNRCPGIGVYLKLTGGFLPIWQEFVAVIKTHTEALRFGERKVLGETMVRSGLRATNGEWLFEQNANPDCEVTFRDGWRNLRIVLTGLNVKVETFIKRP